MQTSRARLVCRAHNRFTPSIALWEHFIGPHLPSLHQQCFSSTATETAQDGIDANSAAAYEVVADPQEANGPQRPEAGAEGVVEKAGTEPAPKVRKMTTVKGPWLPNKVDASIAKNKMELWASREVSLTAPEKLLATARAAFADSQDYEGVAVKPMVSKTPIKESSLPWCLKKIERDIPAMDVLDKEIERFYRYTKPKDVEQKAREHIIKQVRAHVKKVFPNYDVEVFGSERNRVAFATSDIDFRLMRPSQTSDPIMAKMPPSKEEQNKRLKKLIQLYNRIFKNHAAYFLSAVRYARYPLISAQDRNSGLDIQVVLSNDTSHSSAMMQQYMKEIPYLRKLYYVVKNIFDIRGLSDVYRGGFGSYPIFMMLVASIKHAPHERQDAAGALLNFLKFYRDFDTTKHGISIEPVALFDKTKHPVVSKAVEAKLKNGTAKPLPEYMLCLRDPADETNDLGRKGIAIKHVQATFGHLYNQLVQDLKVNTRISLLAPLVGPSYMLNYKRREKLQKYGMRLQEQTHKALAAKAKTIREADKHDKLDHKDTANPHTSINHAEPIESVGEGTLPNL